MTNKSKILHVFNANNILSKKFFYFLKDNDFDLSKHELFHYGKHVDGFDDLKINYTFSSLFSVVKHLKLLSLMHSHDRLFIHSLASPWLLFYLYVFPGLNKKVYWVIWGKDLYFYKLLTRKYYYHEIYEFFRKRVFRQIEHVISIQGDYDLAAEWYGVKAVRHECFMYTSNLYKELHLAPETHSGINILVGNSADPSNNHLEVFEKLKPYIDEDIKVIVPISYGDKNHAKKVIEAGRDIFGAKFIPLTKFMLNDEYLELLASVDVAIFNHRRQQAMGNITTLLGLGKKVYIRSDQSSWSYFKGYEIEIFDVTTPLELKSLDEDVAFSNIDKIKSTFSKDNLIKDLRELL